MKTSHVLLAATLALSLTACGGGDDDEPVAEEPAPAAPAVPDGPNLAEFEDTWQPAVNNQQPCEPNFPYAVPYFFRGRDTRFENTAGGLEVHYAAEVFSDLNCTNKLGLIIETFTLQPELVTVAGRENVIRGVPSFTSSETSNDGGAGMPVISPPDGTLTGLGDIKSLYDVVGDQLFVRVAQPNVPLDAEGFPQEFDPQAFLVRK